MRTFKQHNIRDIIKDAVINYFSNSEKDNGKKVLKNLSQSLEHRDDVADIMLDHGANVEDFANIGLTEEVGMSSSSSAPGTTTANIPDPLETFQGTSSAIMKRVDEEYDDTFLGRPVFNVSESTYGNFFNGKNRYHRWSKYINMNEDVRIYEYVKKNPKKSIILRNNIGAMINVKPEHHIH